MKQVLGGLSPALQNDPHAASAADDARFMRDALMLGRRGLGRTWPNPSVGAVGVQEIGGVPTVVGRGFTQPGGRPHGEAVAFEQAGALAAGGTLYVTLEHCSHRTVRGGVPCVERTLLAGVRRVVSAMVDPNPMIAGLGHALLRAAGVRVDVGIGGEEAAHDQRGHVLRVTQKRPMVTFKIARTANGIAGASGGERLMITWPQANAAVHLARAHHDAIMLGIGSVLADDPMLTVRLPGLAERSPVRVVLDTHLRLPPASRLADSARAVPLWVVAGEGASIDAERAIVGKGAEVLRVGLGPDGRVDLDEALGLLATRGITRVFAEGGPALGEALAAAGLVDEALILTSPESFAGSGVAALGPTLVQALADPARFALRDEGAYGRDRFAHFVRTI
jgi:diaminohydroxyphosphoribosylaminopyrimidine deaminase/5-amino-6-(5-phosphoribosylamino)uracil reductase